MGRKTHYFGLSTRNSFFCFASLILFFENIRVTLSDCSDMPVSLSNMGVCTDGLCQSTQVASYNIPASKGSGTCLSMQAPDSSDTTYTFHFTVNHAYFRWNILSTYYCDDPAVDFKAFCSCPGGTPADCASSRIRPKYLDIVLCTTGIHKSGDCPLVSFGKTGTYVANTGLSLGKRFKVLEISPTAFLDVGMVVEVHGKQFEFLGFMEYDGAPTSLFLSDGAIFKANVISDTVKFPNIPKYVVFDIAAPDDFYLLDEGAVNSLNEFVPGKIGWNKIHVDGVKMAAPGLGNLINVTMQSCKKDKFSEALPWVNTADYLSQSQQFLSGARIPGSILVDPEFNPEGISGGGAPDHYFDPYYYMIDGVTLVVNGNLQFFGQSDNGEFIPSHDLLQSEPIVDQVASWGLKWSSSSPLVKYLAEMGSNAVMSWMESVNLSTKDLCPSNPYWLNDHNSWDQAGAQCLTSLFGGGKIYASTPVVINDVSKVIWVATVDDLSCKYRPTVLPGDRNKTVIGPCGPGNIVLWGFADQDTKTSLSKALAFPKHTNALVTGGATITVDAPSDLNLTNLAIDTTGQSGLLMKITFSLSRASNFSNFMEYLMPMSVPTGVTTTSYSVYADNNGTTPMPIILGITNAPCSPNGVYVYKLMRPAGFQTVNLTFTVMGVQLCNQTHLLSVGYSAAKARLLADGTPGVALIPITSFITKGWPDFNEYKYNWDYRGWNKALQASPVGDSYLLAPIASGAIQGTFTFTNFTIKVDVATIRPVINKVDAAESVLTIEVYSATAGGTAYIGSVPPGLIITRPITISPTPITVKVPLSIPSYKGKLSVIVTSGNFKDQKEISVDFDQTLSYASTMKNFVENVTPESLQYNWDNLFNADLKVGTRLKAFGYILLWVCVGIIGLCVLLFLSRFVWRRLRMRKSPAVKYKRL